MFDYINPMGSTREHSVAQLGTKNGRAMLLSFARLWGWDGVGTDGVLLLPASECCPGFVLEPEDSQASALS